MKMMRLTPQEAAQRMESLGLLTDVDTLIDKYAIDKAARRLNGDKTWLVASEGVQG